jgi:hypothetical protein
MDKIRGARVVSCLGAEWMQGDRPLAPAKCFVAGWAAETVGGGVQREVGPHLAALPGSL